MTDRPILFSAPMVRALIEGRKTQTRRVLKGPTPPADADRVFTWFPPAHVPIEGIRNQWAPGGLWADQDMRGEPGEFGYKGGYKRHVGFLRCRPGDRLWVRESFMPAPLEAVPDEVRPTRWNIAYAAGDQRELIAPAEYNPVLYNYGRWSPSIHMPRWASRITLIVTDVRVQRLQEISDSGASNDCTAEGIYHCGMTVPTYEEWHGAGFRSAEKHMFRTLWDDLNAKRGCGWDANPWVLALAFTVHRTNIDQLESPTGGGRNA